MALVNLKDVTVFTTFSKGFRVVEESKSRDGKDYSTRSRGFWARRSTTGPTRTGRHDTRWSCR